MLTQYPQVIHTYLNHALDSRRWQHYRPRPDDIIIATSYKSGTTWMQEIVRQLIFLGQDVPERDGVRLGAISFWLDTDGGPIDEVIAKLEAQQHRRFIKSHLALDGLLFFPQVKYIVVGRDARDVAMSMWNQYSGFTDKMFEGIHKRGGALPPPPHDVHVFWRNWITRGWFDWESEGYPFGCNLHHTQTWWNYRHLPNILFVHYNDLKSDLTAEIRRVADFLAISVTDDALPPVLEAVSLDAIRAKEQRVNAGWQEVFKEGVNTFFYKGTNGRWKDVLSTEELALYDEKAAQVLTPGCRAWLEQGRVALGGFG